MAVTTASAMPRHHGRGTDTLSGHLGRHQRQQGRQRRVVRVGTPQHQHLGHQLSEWMHGRLVEFERAADDQRARTATASTHVVRGRADRILVELLERPRVRGGRVGNCVAGAARQQCHVARADPERFLRRQPQPAPAIDHEVKTHAVLTRDLHAPWRRHVGAAVRRAHQPQILKNGTQQIEVG